MKKILLIEDNDDLRNNTVELLELSNYKVIAAENGKVGVAMALAHFPDLIICDIMMPELDGFGVLHAIHHNEAIRDTPFIFLTAKADRSDFRKGMELGADDYITKPFSGTELLKAVDSRLKKHALLAPLLSSAQDGINYPGQGSHSEQVLAELTNGRNINYYKKKQLVYSEGNHPNRLYYVVSGKVKAYMRNEDGKELVTQLFSPGDFLGFIALLEGTVYKDTAEALEDSSLAVIPRDEFQDLVNNSPDVAHQFIRLLANNVSGKEQQLLGLAYNSLRKKVAEAILLLQKKYQAPNGSPFVIEISRESLATIAGTATESVIRTLSDFRSEQLIDIQQGAIRILDQQKLQKLAN